MQRSGQAQGANPIDLQESVPVDGIESVVLLS